MWDDAQALRKLSSSLFGISFALVFGGALYFALHLPGFSLRVVQLNAAPQRVDVAQIEAVVHSELHGNFFTVDMDQVRRSFEKLPWVRKVSVRRHFPWQLEVTLEEQVALARWNGTELVNMQGEVFAAETDQALPAFIGPGNDAAAEVTQRYVRYGALLAPLQQQIAQISLSPRQAWQLRLQDGMVLELGRDQMEQRLAQFVAVYPYSLATLPQRVRYVDLRYRNGFAAYLPGGAAGGKV